MNNPKVSVIMSTYNDAPYLTDTINSVLAQSYKAWELIIFDDASKDKTENIIKEYLRKTKKISYVKNEINLGQTKNLNKAIKLAKGEFIARIDGDDIWTDKNKLQKQIDFLTKNTDHGLVGSWWTTIDAKGKRLKQFTYPTDDRSLRNYILIENCFVHSSVLIRKSVLDRIGKYNEKYHWSQDYDLWLRIGKISKFYNIPEFMVGYRINPKGMTQTNYREQLEDTFNIIKTYKNDYPNFTKGYILWKLRIYFPRRFREMISKILR